MHTFDLVRNGETHHGTVEGLRLHRRGDPDWPNGCIEPIFSEQISTMEKTIIERRTPRLGPGELTAALVAAGAPAALNTAAKFADFCDLVCEHLARDKWED
jgi:hypothetical protein